MADESKSGTMNFSSIQQEDVPKGREGKHKKIISKLLNDIDQLATGSALKVPLTKLPDTKENIRSALNRATRQRGVEVSTSSDEDYLYIWKTEVKS
jgi:TusA-related sulfurtransferase